MIKHLKPKSKWLISYYKILDFTKKVFKRNKFKIYSRYVNAKTRCEWTSELVKDLDTFYSIEDFEQLLNQKLDEIKET